MTSGKGERVAEICMALGRPTETFDRRESSREITDLVLRQPDADASELSPGRMRRSFDPGNMESALLDTYEFVQRLPSRLNRLFEDLVEHEFRVRVDAVDEVSQLITDLRNG